ncbi:hypothetical protein [Comamonas sp. F1-6]|uniref:hypothetical protein n=1 Tax=Comamonas sp. F1-6 TaxID=673550 RepID=UPI0031D6BC26
MFFAEPLRQWLCAIAPFTVGRYICIMAPMARREIATAALPPAVGQELSLNRQ